MTHLTSTCRTRGHAGPGRSSFAAGSRGNREGTPLSLPGCSLRGRGRSPRPLAASLGPPPHCSSERRRAPAALGGATCTPGPPPRRRPNPVHPERKHLPLTDPQEETPRLPRLRLAAEGSGLTYRRRRPFSAGAPTGGAEEPSWTPRVKRSAAAARPAAGTEEEAQLPSRSSRGSRTLGGPGGTDLRRLGAGTRAGPRCVGRSLEGLGREAGPWRIGARPKVGLLCGRGEAGRRGGPSARGGRG